jgi:hypothetical protein
MKKMQLIASFLIGLASVAAAPAVFAGPPGKPPPAPKELTPAQRVVLATCRALEEASMRACGAIREATAQGIMVMITAKRAGASNEQIQAIGRTAAEEVGRRADAGAEAVGGIRMRGLDALRDADGTDAQADRINNCATMALANIRRCKTQSEMAIADAVRRLTR